MSRVSVPVVLRGGDEEHGREGLEEEESLVEGAPAGGVGGSDVSESEEAGGSPMCSEGKWGQVGVSVGQGELLGRDVIKRRPRR